MNIFNLKNKKHFKYFNSIIHAKDFHKSNYFFLLENLHIATKALYEYRKVIL